ncbi:hypothetical protein DEJ02_00545 [Curtobacterium sp. MCLR17_042]|nr:hypothetical protein DEJ02_00545 [Curtobacterium sp. MCLR17_042]
MELADGGAMWDHANWSPLCAGHHLSKTKQAARQRASRLAHQTRAEQSTPSLAMQMWERMR